MQRLLIFPPELAYGSKGVQEIPPDATIEVTCFYLFPNISYMKMKSKVKFLLELKWSIVFCIFMRYGNHLWWVLQLAVVVVSVWLALPWLDHQARDHIIFFPSQNETVTFFVPKLKMLRGAVLRGIVAKIVYIHRLLFLNCVNFWSWKSSNYLFHL